MRLTQTVSLNRYRMKKLLILNGTLMKYSIHFLLYWHLQKEDSVILCDTALHHTNKEIILRLLDVFAEFNDKDRIICISKGVWTPRFVIYFICAVCHLIILDFICIVRSDARDKLWCYVTFICVSVLVIKTDLIRWGYILRVYSQCRLFCNPSIHYAYQVYYHFIVTTCFSPLGPSSGD
jgi:hypothetical protein